MADKTYKLTFGMSDGTSQSVQFTAPQGPKGDTGPKGDAGEKGDPGAKGDAFTYADFTSDQLAALKGPKGDAGAKGETGASGVGIKTIAITEV